MSKYFSRSEFSCNCGCGFDTVDFELIQMLDGLRENFDKPIHILVDVGVRITTPR